MQLLQEVQVTNTLNITTILSVISAVSLLGGIVIAVIFKLVKAIQTQIFELQLQSVKNSAAIVEAQRTVHDSLQACIHQIPGHPENPNGVTTNAS